MTNWEHFFGTPERAALMDVEFYAIPAMVAVKHEEKAGDAATLRLVAPLRLARGVPGMAQVRAVRRMNRRDANWGCLLAIAAIIAIDAAAIYAIRALVLGLMAWPVAAC